MTQGLASILASIQELAETLRQRLDQHRRFHKNLLLFFQRDSVNDTFTLLERHKTTLLLYVTFDTAATVGKLNFRRIYPSNQTMPGSKVCPGLSHYAARIADASIA